MEVHHHPHSSRKNWTHYFWEFLMLFLAVFCGFLAENYREHFVEHKREKQFIVSFTKDLWLDSIWLDTVNVSARDRINNLDSAIITLSQLTGNEIPVRTYRQLRKSSAGLMYFPNNGTMTQLKSSGGMRLIRNRAVVDSIEVYDRLIRRLEIRRDITNEIVHDFTNILNKAVSGRDLAHLHLDSSMFVTPEERKQTIAINPEYLNELINQSLSLKLRATSDTGANNVNKRTAHSIIGFLRKAYHIK